MTNWAADVAPEYSIGEFVVTAQGLAGNRELKTVIGNFRLAELRQVTGGWEELQEKKKLNRRKRKKIDDDDEDEEAEGAGEKQAGDGNNASGDNGGDQETSPKNDVNALMNDPEVKKRIEMNRKLAMERRRQATLRAGQAKPAAAEGPEDDFIDPNDCIDQEDMDMDVLDDMNQWHGPQDSGNNRPQAAQIPDKRVDDFNRADAMVQMKATGSQVKENQTAMDSVPQTSEQGDGPGKPATKKQTSDGNEKRAAEIEIKAYDEAKSSLSPKINDTDQQGLKALSNSGTALTNGTGNTIAITATSAKVTAEDKSDESKSPTSTQEPSERTDKAQTGEAAPKHDRNKAGCKDVRTSGEAHSVEVDADADADMLGEFEATNDEDY